MPTSQVKWYKIKMERQLSPLDQLVFTVDMALRAVCAPANRQVSRENPAKGLLESKLSAAEIRHVAGLMRVNHAGEVCAQALYQGQALTAKLETVREKMTLAALEEVDHLGWCEERLRELHNAPSQLNAVWYAGSLMLGMVAGCVGDRWSLGFVMETERQVSAHLQEHIRRLPSKDAKSRAILSQMQEDESKHAQMAQRAGAAKLPLVIRQAMGLMSKLMTQTSYYF
jgi:ubiquinone biosynthesis monooxygenase Coq7